MEYSFDIALAKKYGVNEAIFLKNMQFWISKNYANEKNRREGRTWTYNTFDALQKMFNFWSIDQIRRIVKKLASNNVIVVKKFSKEKKSSNRTNHYAFFKESDFLGHLIEESETQESVDNSSDLEEHPAKSPVSSGEIAGISTSDLYISDSKLKYINPTPQFLFDDFLNKLKTGECNGMDISNYPIDQQAVCLLAFFRHKTGKAVLPVRPNIKLVLARLKEGVDQREIRQVMVRKFYEWKDSPVMSKYARLSTILRPSKFYEYVQELGTPMIPCK